MSYWNKVIEEVLNKHDPQHRVAFTSAREYTKREKQPKSILEEAATTNKKSHPSSYDQKAIKYNLGGAFPNVYFTKRETQVIYHLVIKSMSTTQVANQFKLSRRTVEFYINNMKAKLMCHSQAELIRTVSKTGFLKLIDPKEMQNAPSSELEIST